MNRAAIPKAKNYLLERLALNLHVLCGPSSVCIFFFFLNNRNFFSWWLLNYSQIF